MLVSVQYARAAAALLVVTGHMSGFAAFHPISESHFGGFGVDIFFVISGFIMWETSKDQRPADFMLRRLSRIVPPYWFYTTLLVVVALAVPALTPNIELSIKALLGSYFFLPYTDQRGLLNPILLQGWTLNLEMYFYVIFALSLFIPSRLGRFLAVAVYFAIAILMGLGADGKWAIVTRFTSPIVIEFVFGMIVSVAWNRWKIDSRLALAIFLSSAALLIYVDAYHLSGEINFIAYGIPAAFLLFGLLGMEDYLSKNRLPVLVAAGDASYSLYLSHPFILSLFHALFQRWGKNHLGLDGVSLALVFAATAIIVAVAFAYASYLLLEKPAAKFVLRKFSGRKPVGKSGVATA
jgi:exopolysaccharide production protein ExoZ